METALTEKKKKKKDVYCKGKTKQTMKDAAPAAEIHNP